MPVDFVTSNHQLVCIEDFEEYGEKYLAKNCFDFFSYGTGENVTIKDNQDAFKRLRLRPRVLRNVSNLDTSTTILDTRISSPIGASPTANHFVAHKDGELATARGAQQAEVCMIQSQFSNYSYKDVSLAAPHCLKWVQVYILKDRSETQQLIEKAESAGYKAVVVTIDSPVIQKKKVFKRGNHDDFSRMKNTLGFPNMNVEKLCQQYGHETYVEDNLSFSDITWLCSITKLPVIVKGILTGEDALLAVKYGASGIIVSNHGGRQLDGVPATIEAIPEVFKAVDGKVEIYLDGGVRQGTDILKALALGARAVFVGRPVIWGLAHGGEEGVAKVFNILKEEFRTAMALSGCASISEITSIPNLVVREDFYHSKL